jgi:hypothetical protein
MTRALIATAFCLTSVVPCLAEQAPATHYVVEVQCGQDFTVPAHWSTVLAETARKLVESSEYTSRSPSWHFPISELQAEYGRAITGDHLRVIFDSDQKISARDGTLLTAREIVVLLSDENQGSPSFPDRFVDSVFTLDDQRQVVGYALYSGIMAMKLWSAVAQMTGGTNTCHPPSIGAAVR